MTRLYFRTVVVVMSLVSCVVMRGEKAAQPNIIYILADDLGYGDLSINGQIHFDTPNIDRMAAEGMLFTQHYSGSTVCAPSRSSLMTGQHTGHTPVRGNLEIMPEGQHPLPADTVTLPRVLREAGYVTGAFGKWGLGYPGSEGDPMEHFDRFYGFNCQRLGHHYYPFHLWDDDEKVVLEENAGTAKGIYAPSLIHDETLQFIKDNKDSPFFCYVASIIPHAELIAPEEYMEKFRGKIETGAAFTGVDEGEELRLGKYQSQEEPHVAFAAMVALLDDQVGEILATLDELGIAENTLVVFTSDNGPHEEGGADPSFFNSNAAFRGLKRDLYEGGIRVPMVARWEGTIDASSNSDHVSAFWDMMPTFAEMAGVASPEAINGISMLPTLLGRSAEQEEHNYLYWEFHELGGRKALRKGKWKLVKYNVLSNPDAPAQLHNLDKDPGESHDLASARPKVYKRLMELMESARVPSDVFTFSSVQFEGGPGDQK
ncbi:arylsulfatase [Puniceicoccaceae bacterium K14]|nr:arylsulfatase [Puniceicoccaceae bacterium K14]